MSELIKKVYIDQDQCEEFGSEYFNSCGLDISCRDLQRSKRYDSAHTKLFDTYPDSIFHLRREESDSPGWYSWSIYINQKVWKITLVGIDKTMKVIKTDKKPIAIPDYYKFYLSWLSIAELTGENHAYTEAYRLARLAEEFGLAVIEDDETMEDMI